MAPRKKSAARQSRSSTPKLQKGAEEPVFPENFDWAAVEQNRGAPARQYLLKSLTPYILDGLREVNKVRPENPVQWLGEYLLAVKDLPKEEDSKVMHTDLGTKWNPESNTDTSGTPGLHASPKEETPDLRSSMSEETADADISSNQMQIDSTDSAGIQNTDDHVKLETSEPNLPYMKTENNPAENGSVAEPNGFNSSSGLSERSASDPPI